MSDWEDEEQVVAVNRFSAPSAAQEADEWNGNFAGPEKSATANDAISFEIDSGSVGMVIGRGGAKIREIEEKFQVNLNIGKNVRRFRSAN